MTEFDFDELDKAVNSLMKKTPPEEDEGSTNTPSSQPETNPVPQSSQPAKNQPADVSTASLDNASPVKPEAVSQPPAKPLAPSPGARKAANELSLPTKRRGSFMDVVHPSSDMRAKQTTVNRPASRQGATIAPIEKEPATAVDSSAQLKTQKQPEARKTSPVTTPVAPAVPRQADDALLLNTLSNVASEESSRANSDDSARVPTSEAATLADQELTASLDTLQVESTESLFIPDAKVEKRPLGASVSPSGSASNEEMSDAQLADDKPVKFPLPDELSPKVMNIESENNTKPAETPVLTKEPDVSGSNSGGPLTQPTATSPVVVPGSIPQQYQQQKPADLDEDHPAIYDPAYYKQEMQKHRVEKSRSGWWVVLAVVGLIIIGGTGGVLYYFYSTGSF